MTRGERLDARLRRLVETSPHELTVVYPPVQRTATGVSPGTAPLSPLTGRPPDAVVFEDEPTPSQASVTVPCLWYDSFTSVTSALSADQIKINRIGWHAGASTLACVLIDDAAVDATDASGLTVFDAASHVEHRGHRYRILAWEPVSRGWSEHPLVYWVWLAGAKRQ
jgi:hypothetical protein